MHFDGTAYEVTGQGPNIALIHGLGLNRQMWQWLVPDLASEYRVLTYDILGHGESKNPDGKPVLKLYAKQLANLLDCCEMTPTAVVGFSLGGMIARRFALDFPNKLTVLAILCSAHDRTQAERDAVLKRVIQARESGPSATVEGALERWFTPNYKAKNPTMMKLVRDWVVANDPKVYPDIYHMMAEGDRELASTISTVIHPTLVVTGEDDLGNTPDMANRMATTMPNARTEIIPGLRHMGLVESPDLFNKPVLDFFRSNFK